MHGPTGDGGIKAEPNLVPLLDLVFQLIMFFMICVNFVSAQSDQDIKLPESQSARALDKSVEALTLNLTKEGEVKVFGEKNPFSIPTGVKYYLRREFDNARTAARARGEKGEKVDTVIIIRPDKEASYDKIYELLSVCKEIGFHKLQLRAYPKLTKG
jgi:biopolymer transport protein ExbD